MVLSVLHFSDNFSGTFSRADRENAANRICYLVGPDKVSRPARREFIAWELSAICKTFFSLIRVG